MVDKEKVIKEVHTTQFVDKEKARVTYTSQIYGGTEGSQFVHLEVTDEDSEKAYKTIKKLFDDVLPTITEEEKEELLNKRASRAVEVG